MTGSVVPHQRLILAGATALLLCVFASNAQAQIRFAWQLDGGGLLPLSAYVHNGVRADSTAIDTQEETLMPRLVEQFASPGFQIGTSFLLNQFEIRYSFQRLGWDHALVVCTATQPATRLGSGEIDDTTAAYACQDEDQSPLENLDDAGLEPFIVHTLSVGVRIPLWGDSESLRGYAFVGPGLALSTYDDSGQGHDQFGFELAAGMGAQLPLAGPLALAAEMRYHLMLFSPPSQHQLAANRSAARDESALSAVLDAFHWASLTLGLSIQFQ